ncbi:C40 family peptidase [Nocardioides sp. W3-2-3]|uniref:C40 family peptidase n=1 Tax=Nocardioides convexus TaxID=2712224 RepID=UPI002418AF31|nr:C40 family peptidase [Nocardioides convexus]NHA00022.1 C40 family peptidase [Nocardioides convexus]
MRDDVRDALIERYQNGGAGPAGEPALLRLRGIPRRGLHALHRRRHPGLAALRLRRRVWPPTASAAARPRSGATRSASSRRAWPRRRRAPTTKLAEAKALLSKLEEAQRTAILSRGDVRAPDAGSIPASGRASAAIKYALAQVGDAYVYGAAGPSAFDCSGLTMMAWAQAGVSLPHSSRAQMGSGTPVSKSDLQPGDLVFYYSPVSHVALYLGNGMIVHAANPGAGVKVSSVDEMPYAGAVRPG